MPSPLVATAGASNANVYLTVAQADQWFDNRPGGSVWATQTEDNKERNLLFATRRLDDLIVWAGRRSTTTQALDWPRDGLYRDGTIPVDNATIPPEIMDATAELAGWFIGDTAFHVGSGGSPASVEEIRAGSILVKYGEGGTEISDRAKIPDDVLFGIPPSWILDNLDPSGDFRTVKVLRA